MGVQNQDILILETKNCTGCRACEIACSFHHKTVFSQSLSSIQIHELPQRKGFNLSFFLKPKGKHLSCDGCVGLKVPFCVKYCNPLMRSELSEIIKGKTSSISESEEKR
jgi:Fe-S-cluster-containing hydrogenase component 2